MRRFTNFCRRKLSPEPSRDQCTECKNSKSSVRTIANASGGCGNLAAPSARRGCYESVRFDGDSGRPTRSTPSCHAAARSPDAGGIMLARRCLIIAAFALCCSAAHAEQKPFYAGKQLTILVNYDPGGPTDLEARLLSRHLGRHIAGH